MFITRAFRCLLIRFYTHKMTLQFGRANKLIMSETPSTENKPQITYRGENMSRVETFVAAAFAFATTMLVISIGTVPQTMDEFVLAAKNVPSFLASSAIILWIWYSHAHWSRWYGLEDGKTIWYSGALICIVLVYIYPLRLMMQGLFMHISFGFFPLELRIETLPQLRFVFAFYAAGFTLLSLNFLLLYFHAFKQRDALKLEEYELFETRFEIYHWYMNLAVCALTFITTLVISDRYLQFSPYLYCLFLPANIVFVKLKNDALKQRGWTQA